MYKDTLKEIEINDKIKELKNLLWERFGDTTKLEEDIQILRSIYFDKQTYKKQEKIEALKLSENVNIRIFAKRYEENLDYITKLNNENLRLKKIEEKYNAILENIS